VEASDLLAVSIMPGHAIRDAVQASEMARERGSRVIWGGPHVTLFPQQTLRQVPVDVAYSVSLAIYPSLLENSVMASTREFEEARVRAEHMKIEGEAPQIGCR
jgi:hypothetical protein